MENYSLSKYTYDDFIYVLSSTVFLAYHLLQYSHALKPQIR